MRAALLLVIVAACSIPNTQFRASADGGTSDGVAGAIEIRPSTTNLAVDEGGSAMFTVALSQAPADQVTVAVAPAAQADTTAIAITETQLVFLPSTFDQPQTIHVSGLVDADAADAHAMIALTADTLSTVDVGVTVHDPDKVEIATDVTGTALSVNENGSADIHVHLSHEPAGDVQVMIGLASGPVQLSTTVLTFTRMTYAADQLVRLTGLDDANATSETLALAFTSTAAGLTEADYTVHTIDDDALNMHVTPTTPMMITEGTTAGIGVSLTAQPPTTVHVTVGVRTGKVGIDKTDLAFTTSNWATVQTVTVTALQDPDTMNDGDSVDFALAGSTPISVSVTNVDNDVQQILTNAPNTVTVAEGATASFGATLKFQPASAITIAVASSNTGVATVSTGALTFTPTNYNDPTMHQVTVTGVHDTNLATNAATVNLSENSIGTTMVAVSVTDVDHQAIVLSTTSLAIPEGQASSFDVSLKYDPGTTVTLTIADTNPTALPISQSSVTFTGGPTGDWGTPVTVMVSPPIDTNATSETATITVKGAPAGAPDAAVSASVTDGTVLAQYGWPVTPSMPAFTGTSLIAASAVIAYKVTIPAATNLDALGVYVSAAGGYTQMALYRDAGGAPGALVGGTGAPYALVGGANTLDISPDVPITTTTTTTFWIAVRFSQNTSVAYSTSATGTVCNRNQDITLIDGSWPATYGAATCVTDNLVNLWINTYHQ